MEQLEPDCLWEANLQLVLQVQVIVSYAIGGLIAFALMACLAEMTVQHPTSGSFGAYAEHYISPLAGFLVRYCYWACIVLAVGTEITAVADYMKLWFPNVDSWVWIGFFTDLTCCKCL